MEISDASMQHVCGGRHRNDIALANAYLGLLLSFTWFLR